MSPPLSGACLYLPHSAGLAPPPQLWGHAQTVMLRRIYSPFGPSPQWVTPDTLLGMTGAGAPTWDTARSLNVWLLSERSTEWRCLCPMSRWMERLIRSGYTMRFAITPSRFNGLLETILPALEQGVALQSKIRELLRKDIISRVPARRRKWSFTPSTS